jgi:hypothetical protein
MCTWSWSRASSSRTVSSVTECMVEVVPQDGVRYVAHEAAISTATATASDGCFSRHSRNGDPLPLSAIERMLLCDHDYRFAGKGLPVEGKCGNRTRFTCVHGCGSSWDKNCGHARPSRCAHCAEVKRGDIAAVGRSGWAVVGTRGVWLTLTAPGVDVLPFDLPSCSHTADVKCSGDLGCVADPVELAKWHNDIGQKWTHFVTELRRSLPVGVTVEFFKTYEEQKRGALHIHVMMRVEGCVTHRQFIRCAGKARRLNGFGPQMKCEAIELDDVRQAARKAGYCAKYASKNADALPSVTRLDVRTGEVRSGGLRSWSSSRRWGVTMASLRGVRVRWVTQAGTEPRVAPAAGDGPAGPLDLYRDSYASSGSRWLGLWLFCDELAKASAG